MEIQEPPDTNSLKDPGQVSRPMLSRIHQDALRVLEETGVRCASAEVQNVLVDTGLAAYDDTTGHLHVLSPLVEQALATVPGRGAYRVPTNSFGVGGTAPFIFDDPGGGWVAPTLADVARIATIVEQAAPVNFMARGGIGTVSRSRGHGYHDRPLP